MVTVLQRVNTYYQRMTFLFGAIRLRLSGEHQVHYQEHVEPLNYAKFKDIYKCLIVYCIAK